MFADATRIEAMNAVRRAGSAIAAKTTLADQAGARLRDEALPLIEQVARDAAAARVAMGEEVFHLVAHLMAVKILADVQQNRLADLLSEAEGLADVA